MATIIPSVEELLNEAVALYHKEFNKSPEIAAFGPGRVNLIGEHIDYNDGFVLPMALPLVTLVVGGKNGTQEVRLFTSSKDVDEPNKVNFFINSEIQRGTPKWSNYIKGVIIQFGGSVPGFDVVIVSSVPLGAGLSSSAAIEVATITFLEALTGKVLSSKIQKALSCQKAEHEYAGVPCGIMDQLVCVLGKENMAVLIDCRSLEVTYVPLEDDDIFILITDSNVKHELSSGEYAVRKTQCESIIRLLNKESFREVTEDDLLKLKSLGADETLIARGRHVVSEIKRTEEGAKALIEKDFIKFGKLMLESHDSLRYDYEVSCKELDDIVESTLNLDGVFGSRMTGGGFGGCTVTLLKREALHKCIASIKKRCIGNPIFYVCKAAEGAKSLSVPHSMLLN